MATLQGIAENRNSIEFNDLPRLLYFGDIPPESTVESPSLLFRLLQDYPKDRLRVLFRSKYASYASDATHRLSGVTYDTFHFDLLGLPVTRFSLNRIATLFSARFIYRGAWKVAKQFRPEAILSIAHGFGCLSAAAVARRLRVPLHLILHDDWINWVGIPQQLISAAHREFGRVYRQSKSRLCITPYMEHEYARRYQATGQILYPPRPSDLPDFETPSVREGRLTVAFAGTVWSGYAVGLRRVAAYLSQVGGRLLLFTRHSDADLRKLELIGPTVDARPFCPADELVRLLRKEADMLLLPMDFAIKSNCNMMYAFPSKFTVYTATGVPMIIWGPPECSAVKWARQYGDIAEIVDTEDEALLEATVHRLALDRKLRHYLATRALTAGREYFSYLQARDSFFSCLVNPKRDR